MIPGEVIAAAGEIELNAGRRTCRLEVVNRGDRPIQVGSHYHFAETNAALDFDRKAARGMRLNIAAGTAVRFEPGQSRTVELVDYAGARAVYGFNAAVMGSLNSRTQRAAAETSREPGKRKAVAPGAAAAGSRNAGAARSVKARKTGPAKASKRGTRR